MTNHLIFFGSDDRKSDSGRWVRRLEEGAELAYAVETTPALDTHSLGFGEAVQKVRDALQGSPGVVLVATAGDDRHPVRLLVSRNPGKTGSGPARALLMDFEGRSQWLSLDDGTDVEIAPWQCVIVPVSSALESKLDAFVRSVVDLPDDVRVSMLLNLIMPTLENRIARLEQTEEMVRQFKLGSDAIRSLQRPRSSRDQLWNNVVITLIAIAIVGAWLYLLALMLGTQEAVARIDARLAASNAAVDQSQGTPASASGQNPGVDPTAAPVGGATRRTGTVVDELTGLFPKRGVLDNAEWFVLDKIHFSQAEPLWTPEATGQIEELALVLQRHPNTSIEIGGFTDDEGDRAVNVTRSAARATAVATVVKKTAGTRIGGVRPTGYGELDPIESNQTQQGRRQNVRVSIRVLR